MSVATLLECSVDHKCLLESTHILEAKSGCCGKDSMADCEQSSELTFASPEEERDYWKSKALEYRTRYGYSTRLGYECTCMCTDTV